jgi:hypothetical protein
LHKRWRLFEIAIHVEQHMLAAQRNLDNRTMDVRNMDSRWDVDDWILDAGRMERLHLDA